MRAIAAFLTFAVLLGLFCLLAVGGALLVSMGIVEHRPWIAIVGVLCLAGAGAWLLLGGWKKEPPGPYI
jgi:protein-S-isoprenylcysteine O-methyltransferase Ste14